MNIVRRHITIGEIVSGFRDDGEGGVSSMDGALDIRPPYQREFVYDDGRRDLVIDSVLRGLPLNTMYWAVTPSGWEVLDGQQRTLSICMYVAGLFSVRIDGMDMYFHNLPEDARERFLAYDNLTVYICDGTDGERLEWFGRINVAGEPLNAQEIRNAVYAGPWLSDARARFSRRGGPAQRSGDGLVKGSPIRQELLETALGWVAERDGTTVEGYMAAHQHDDDASDLWGHWMAVLDWVRSVFTVSRREMTRVDWGHLHHVRVPLDPEEVEARVSELMLDDDVTAKHGIYAYIVTGDERHLSIRAFLPGQIRTAYEVQGGVCPACGRTCPIEGMEADHVVPWAEGGRTVPENLQLLCRDCNRRKGSR